MITEIRSSMQKIVALAMWKCTWRLSSYPVPKIWVTPVVIHIIFGFSLLNHSAIGVPPWLWKPMVMGKPSMRHSFFAPKKMGKILCITSWRFGDFFVRLGGGGVILTCYVAYKVEQLLFQWLWHWHVCSEQSSDQCRTISSRIFHKGWWY